MHDQNAYLKNPRGLSAIPARDAPAKRKVA
jgi:hypothetical protein